MNREDLPGPYSRTSTLAGESFGWRVISKPGGEDFLRSKGRKVLARFSRKGGVYSIIGILTLFLLLQSGRSWSTYSLVAHVRSPSPGPRDTLGEDLKIDELSEDLRVYKLIRDLNSGNITVRLDAALALGKMKARRAVMPLIFLLQNSTLEVMQAVAATALGDIGDRRAVIPLISILEDRKTLPAVKVAAETALAKIKDLRAVEPLIEKLGHEDPDVRTGAAQALGMMRDLRAVLPLIAALGDENPFVRRNAARALGEIKDPLAVDSLIATFTEDRVSDVRWWAAFALGEIRDPRATAPLSHAVSPEGEESMRPLADVIDVKDREVQAHPLSHLLRGAQWTIQLEAIHSLGKIGEKALEPLVCIFLNHQDLDFRNEAAKMVMDIKGVQYTMGLLKRADRLMAAKSLYVYVISRGESGTEDLLVSALDRFGEIRMALDFVGSKNERLRAAGMEWIRKMGFQSPEKPPTGGPRWGEQRRSSLEASAGDVPTAP